MEKLGYTTTETLLWDHSETEQYYVLAIPPARTVKTLYLVTWEYAFQWFGLNGGNNLKIVYYPFSQIHFRNLADPCACAPEVFTIAASITVSPSSVDEDSGTDLIYTITLDDTSTFDTEITYNVSGTATAGVDYAATFTNPITILAGQTTATITVTPIADLAVEDNETVIVTLLSGTSGTNIISANGSATGTIVDKTVAPLMPAWQWPLSVVPDAPIWQHARADASSYSNGAWLAAAAPHPYPSFVNNGSITQSTSVHTGTLPGSRVNGNLLIFYFKERNTSNDPTVLAGWTLIDNIFSGATYRYGAYYCYVTGAEVAPTLTWAGGGQVVSAIAQYKDVKSTSPTVAGTKNSAQTGTTISTTALTSTANRSLAISFSWDDVALAPTLPSGFTTEAAEGTFQNVFGSMRLCDVQIATSGSSSGAVSCTASSGPWGTILFELKSA